MYISTAKNNTFRAGIYAEPSFMKAGWSKKILGFSVGYLTLLVLVAVVMLSLKGPSVAYHSPQWWKEVGVVYIVYAFLNYIIAYVLVQVVIPFNLARKSYMRMALTSVLVIVSMGFIKRFVGFIFFDFIMVDHYLPPNDEPVYYSIPTYMLKTFWTGFLISLLAYTYKFIRDWFRHEKLRAELENKSMAAELSFLKMQINPHFLFNSLNSIYALTLTKNDEAPRAVLKLSDMMRYMLYEDGDEHQKVELDKEVLYLQNYIDLQRIRFEESACIEFYIDGDASDKKIHPLLLIPFVENAMKHGVLNDTDNPVIVHLIIEENDKLIFAVRNKKNIFTKDRTDGVGLDNVKKRLQLLYAGKYHIQIDETADEYKVELMIKL